MRLSVLFLILLATAGCSSWAPEPEDISAVPAERLLAYSRRRRVRARSW